MTDKTKDPLQLLDANALESILAKHVLWLANPNQGERADLRGANLRGANLRCADLQGILFAAEKPKGEGE